MAESSLNNFSNNALDLSIKTTRKKNRKSAPCKIEYFERDDFVSPYRVSKTSIEDKHDIFVPNSKTEVCVESNVLDSSDKSSEAGKNDNCIKNSSILNPVCETENGVEGNGAFIMCKVEEKTMKSCTFDAVKQIGDVTENNLVCTVDENLTESVHKFSSCCKTEDVTNSCIFPVSVKTEDFSVNGYDNGTLPTPTELMGHGCPTSTSTCKEGSLLFKELENVATMVKPGSRVEVPDEEMLEISPNGEKSFNENSIKTESSRRKKNRKRAPCKIEYFERDDFVSPYRASKMSIEDSHDIFVPNCRTEVCVESNVSDCTNKLGFESSEECKNGIYIKNSSIFNPICKAEKCIESSGDFEGNGAFSACKVEEDNSETREKATNSCTFDTVKHLRKVTENNLVCGVDGRLHKFTDRCETDSCVFPVSIETGEISLNGYDNSTSPTLTGSTEELTPHGCPTSTSTCSKEERVLSSREYANVSTTLKSVCKVEVPDEEMLEMDDEKSFMEDFIKTEELDPSESSCDKLNEDSNESPACEIYDDSTESASPTGESEETEIEDNFELITACKEEEETVKLPPKANYHCEICLKQFTRKDSLAEHVRIHTGEKPYKCIVCFKRFARKKDYYKHRPIHTGEKHPCPLCFKEFAVKSSLRKHIQTHKGEKHHKCGMCDKQFAHKSTLLFHLKTHTGEEPHHCEVCGKKFARRNDLSRHWLTHSGEKNYQCELCFKQFSTKSNLSQHLLIHSDVKTYQCEICLKLFSQKTGLLKHMPIHSEKSFECEVCHKQFSLQSTLTKHMQTHAEVKPYQCELCFKRFALKSTFSGHLLTHTGERHHPCELCPKRFARKSHLARHMLTHTGEKPHKCEVCLKAFAQKSDITQHMLTHTGEKPHQCQMCNKKYSKRSHLTHHMLNHHADKLPRPDPVPVPVGLYPSPIPNPPFYEFLSIEVKANPFPAEVQTEQSSSPAADSRAAAGEEDASVSEENEAVLPPV